MKRINLAWMLIAVLLTAASCSDDDNNTAELSSIRIESAQATFTAVGGTGTIKVNAPAGIVSATSSDSWCVASVTDQSTVSLTVPNYEELATRNAVVTIKDATGDAVNISVTQTGLVLMLDANRLRMGDEAATGTVTCSHSSQVTFTSKESWISGSIEGDNIRVKCEANNTGDMRRGYLYAYSAGECDSILVIQGERKDIEGDYYLSGTRTSDNQQVYLSVTIKDYDDDRVLLSIPSYNWRMALAFDDDNMSMRLCAGTRMGYLRGDDNKIYYMFLNLWDTEAGYYTWLTKYSTDFVFQPRKGGGTVAFLTDNGSWYPCVADALRFDKYTTSTATTGSTELWLALRDPFLRKKTASDATTAPAGIALK